MRSLKLLAATLAAFGMTAAAAVAEPAIIYDMGGKFDKSFNESAYNGAEASYARKLVTADPLDQAASFN